MKKFIKPEIISVDVKDTAHDWLGMYRDGGYIGDGEISGHLSWTQPTDAPVPNPSNPVITDAPEVSLS